MNVHFHEQFEHVLTPLVGEILIGAKYWILESDRLGFDIEDPNTSGGVQSVELTTTNSRIQLTWSWTNVYGSDSASYCISSHIGSINTLLTADAMLQVMDASKSKQWSLVIGQPFKAIEVRGYSDIPQAIHLVLPSDTLVIITGLYYKTVTVGDSDEILVFHKADWPGTKWGVLWCGGI